jgi:hypothetical protein
MSFKGLSILSIAILFAFLISVTDAFTLDMAGIEKSAAIYNSKIESAPYILTSMLGSEKINLIVTRDNGTVFRAGMDIVSAKIKRVVDGGFDDPSILITTTESAIDDVVLSKDKISEFKKLTDDGRIKFEAKSWLAGAKIKAALSSTSVLQFGYNLFFS